jgi:hypothetical protein
MDFSKHSTGPSFTRLHAQITEENGAFSVSVTMHNHLKEDDKAWGIETAPSIEMASGMIGLLAEQFSIPQNCISINFVMDNFKDGTIH